VRDARPGPGVGDRRRGRAPRTIDGLNPAEKRAEGPAVHFVSFRVPPYLSSLKVSSKAGYVPLGRTAKLPRRGLKVAAPVEYFPDAACSPVRTAGGTGKESRADDKARERRVPAPCKMNRSRSFTLWVEPNAPPNRAVQTFRQRRAPPPFDFPAGGSGSCTSHEISRRHDDGRSPFPGCVAAGRPRWVQLAE